MVGVSVGGLGWQRIVAMMLLQNMYRAEGSSKNPFLTFLLSAFEKTPDISERLYIAELLLAPPQSREVSFPESRSPKNCLWA
jgi:hypothetical protein